MQLAAVRFQFPTSLTRSKSTQAEPFLGWVMYPKPMYSIVLPSIKTIVFPVFPYHSWFPLRIHHPNPAFVSAHSKCYLCFSGSRPGSVEELVRLEIVAII